MLRCTELEPVYKTPPRLEDQLTVEVSRLSDLVRDEKEKYRTLSVATLHTFVQRTCTRTSIAPSTAGWPLIAAHAHTALYKPHLLPGLTTSKDPATGLTSCKSTAS